MTSVTYWHVVGLKVMNDLGAHRTAGGTSDDFREAMLTVCGTIIAYVASHGMLYLLAKGVG